MRQPLGNVTVFLVAVASMATIFICGANIVYSEEMNALSPYMGKRPSAATLAEQFTGTRTAGTPTPSIDGLGDGIGYVDLIQFDMQGCYTDYAQSKGERIVNRHPTRRVLVRQITEHQPNGGTAIIMDIVLEPNEQNRPFLGCNKWPNGTETNRIIKEAWLYTTPPLQIK